MSTVHKTIDWKSELKYLRLGWDNMEEEKLRVVFNFFISLSFIGATLYTSQHLDLAIIGATIVQGISFQEIRKAYIQAKSQKLKQ